MGLAHKAVDYDRRESHVLRRLKERYGLQVTKSQLDRLLMRVYSGDCIPLCNQGDCVQVVELGFGGRRLVLVFDAERKSFRTALPSRGKRTVEEYLGSLRQFFQW